MNRKIILDGTRIFLNRFKKSKRYIGDARQICLDIVKDCWNGRYFQVSRGNFSEFYTRDFGYCVDSLIRLGYKEEVERTIRYALSIFSEQKKITTTITPDGSAVDVFDIGPDSLALLIKSILILKNKEIIEEYEEFLNEEINRYFKFIVNEEDGLVKRRRYFSSVKDHCVRDSSCYDNCMIASLADNLKRLGLNNPFKYYNYKKLIKENFWNGTYFRDDLSNDTISSDANIYPYWLGLFNSKAMLKESINSIKDEGLDKPFPIKYSSKRDGRFLSPMKYLVPNYEGNTIWGHNGLNYIKIVLRVDKKLARDYLNKYKEIIEKNKSFIEVFNDDGSIYKTLFYKADSGLLWSSIYLDLEKCLA